MGENIINNGEWRMENRKLFDILKPLIYKTDPEFAHNVVEFIFKTARRCPLFFNPLISKNFVLELYLLDFYQGFHLPLL